MKNPSYEQVSSGATGHAESVKIVYDPSKVTFGQLLKVFFSVAHDPTELDRQGPDYRHAISLRDFLHQRQSGKNREGLYRTAESSEGLPAADRHGSDGLFGVSIRPRTIIRITPKKIRTTRTS